MRKIHWVYNGAARQRYGAGWVLQLIGAKNCECNHLQRRNRSLSFEKGSPAAWIRDPSDGGMSSERAGP